MAATCAPIVAFSCVCLSLVAASLGINPGSVIRVHRSGVNLAAVELAKKMAWQITKAPGLMFDQGLHDYYMKNFRFVDFSVPLSEVTFHPGIGFTLSLTDTVGIVGCKWFYMRELINKNFSESGSVNITFNVSSVSAQVFYEISTNDGKPTASVFRCSASIDKFSVDIGGNTYRTLHDIIIALIEFKLKSIISNMICATVTDIIQKHGIQSLPTLPAEVTIGDQFVMYNDLISAPDITSDYIEVAFTGYCRKRTDRTTPSFPAPMLWIPTNLPSQMMMCYIHDLAVRVRYSGGSIDAESISYGLRHLFRSVQHVLSPGRQAALSRINFS